MAPLFVQLILIALAPVLAEFEMEFTKYPESVTAPIGDEVTFECAVRVPGERLVWRWKPVDAADDRWTEVKGISDKEGVHTKLVVEVKEHIGTALYQCVVWYGGISLASIPARLTVARMELSRNTGERRVITAPLHNTVVLHCKQPLSEPPAVTTWWKEDKGVKKPLETPHGVLVIQNATLEDSGTYGCTASNELSGQTLELPETTYLQVQRESAGGLRFLETQDFVGSLQDDVLTVSVRRGEALRLWCGAVGTPPPAISWFKNGDPLGNYHQELLVAPFTPADEGVYACDANGNRRSWKVVCLSPPSWYGDASDVTASEGARAAVSCGRVAGSPPPVVTWLLNAEAPKGTKAVGTDLIIDPVEKRHAGIVQCFACNKLGCAYDVALLTVVPTQIFDQEYMAEIPKTMHSPPQAPKRHNRKSTRKNKAVMIPPSRPNVTRMSDESVMVSWSHANQGLPIQFFKVQYREATNASNATWLTATHDIPPHIHSFEIDGLVPDRYYKFRIAAVYSNQDNKLGRSSTRFHLTRGGLSPTPPVLQRATPTSPYNIHLEWTWSSNGGILADGFYVYYRAVTSAGAYEKVTAPGGMQARSIVLSYLKPDTSYEAKLQAYTKQAPSEFSTILVAKTLRASPLAPPAVPDNASGGAAAAGAGSGAPSAMLTAGGATGATLLLTLLAVTLLLCRRANRAAANKEKGSVPESTGTNGYIPAKVPITITANPMQAEGGDGGVELSFLHNNNTGSDDTLSHSRKNGTPTRQFV